VTGPVLPDGGSAKFGLGAVFQVNALSDQALEADQTPAPALLDEPAQHWKIALVTTWPAGTVAANLKYPYRAGLASVDTHPVFCTVSGASDATLASAVVALATTSADACGAWETTTTPPARAAAAARAPTRSRRRGVLGIRCCPMITFRGGRAG
jgi:hypothetical protein